MEVGVPIVVLLFWIATILTKKKYLIKKFCLMFFKKSN
jgi:hypothetical protein